MNRFLSFPTIKAQIKLRRLKSPGVPRTPGEIISRGEYLNSQNIEFMSHESQNLVWIEGQRRFIRKNLEQFDRSRRVLDIACGDGIGLSTLQEMGFRNILGVDSNVEKILKAKTYADAFVGDMHNLSFIQDKSLSIILCSHSLEHVYDPKKVLSEFRRILSTGGTLFLVLPFPDYIVLNEKAHLAKYVLGLHKFDHGRSLKKFLNSCDFKVKKVRFDSFREDEIWITAIPN